MPISIQQWGVAYVMAYGLVLTFMDWHKEGGELIVKGKLRKFLQDNWIWKTSCNIFSSLYCQIAKGPYARRLAVKLNFYFLWLVGLCDVPSHFYPKLTSHPQICAPDDTQFTTHFLFEGFLKIFFSWLLKNVTGGTESLASGVRSSSQPTESRFRCLWKIANSITLGSFC